MTPNPLVNWTRSGLTRLGQNEMRPKGGMPLRAGYCERWTSWSAWSQRTNDRKP